MSFEVSTVMFVMIGVFWVVTPCKKFSAEWMKFSTQEP
jgi:hypothetical protein